MENIHPPLPAPPPMPSRLRSQPPRTAPTMPMMIVTIIPPGSGPGMTHLARAPAMSPTMIQNIKADITSYQHSLVVRPYLLCFSSYSSNSSYRGSLLEEQIQGVLLTLPPSLRGSRLRH